MAHSSSKILSISGLLLLAIPAFAQQTPDSTIAAALGSLTTRAGVVFAGEVSAVRPLGGVVEVEFQVNRNLKGASAGSYILREWSGLWATGQRRYWVGERAVVFLTPAGKSGLSSSVDGMEGILPILQSDDAATAVLVDIDRLRTRVLRDAGNPMVDSTGRMSLMQVASIVQPAVVPPLQPIRNPIPAPIHRPILLPVQAPMNFPSPIESAGPAQNVLMFVPSPVDTDSDDFLFADEKASSAKHETSSTPRSIEAGR